MTRIWYVLAALAAAALLTAGCSGELSQEEYEKEVQQIINDADETMDSLSPADAEDPSEEEIDEAVAAVNDIADELDSLNPPAEVEEAHRDLVDGVRALGDVYRDAADIDTESTDPGEAVGAILGSEAFEKLGSAAEAFEEAGYDVEIGGPAG